MEKQVRIFSRRHIVLAGKRIQVRQVKRLQAVVRGSARDVKTLIESFPDLGKEGAQGKPDPGGGQVSKGLGSWSGPKQAGSGEENHPLSLPIFQSLSASSHCPDPTRSH